MNFFEIYAREVFLMKNKLKMIRIEITKSCSWLTVLIHSKILFRKTVNTRTKKVPVGGKFFPERVLKLQYRGNNVYIEKASHHGRSWPNKLGEGNRVGEHL